MKPIRILILSHLYPSKTQPINGIFIHNQTKHLVKAGCQVVMVAPVPYAPKILWFRPRWKDYGQIPLFDRIDDIPVYYPRYVNLPGKRFRVFSIYSIIMGLKNTMSVIIKEFKPQIIHAHTATSDGYVALKFNKDIQLPFVCSLRGSDINIYPHYDRLTLNLTKKVILSADQIVSVSSALKNAAEKIANPKKTIKVIYNGCDLNSFNVNYDYRMQYRQKLNISIEEKSIIFVGELKKSKGVIELISAFIKTKSTYPNLHLSFVGSGPEKTNIKNIISSHRLNERIHLIGKQPSNEVSRWLNASDIFILPSHYEGLPNAILEAMACGLPVIATNVGGIPEAVIDGKTGILVNKHDVQSLIESMIQLIRNEKLAREMGKSGREFVKSHFSWKENADEMVKIYKNILYSKVSSN